MDPNVQSPTHQLLDEAMSYMPAAALRAVALLGVADHLTEGPRTPEELAAATGARPGALYRTLRLLATREIFREDEAGRFHLTPIADPLRTDATPSAREAVIMLTLNAFWRSAGELVTTLRDDHPAFQTLYGTALFEYLTQHPGDGEVFHRGMASFSSTIDQLIVDRFTLPETGVIVDVGGGYGGFLLRALQRHPGLHGVLFDHPSVTTEHQLGELDDPSRWKTESGDFFEAVPAGGNLYMLKHIIHDWHDEGCVTILRNCRRAMTPQGRVLVADTVIPPGNTPSFGKVLDMFMLAILTGRERTEAEFAELFARADLRINRVVDVGAPVSVIEATST